MNRDKWERTFVELLTQHLDIEPEQVRFPWRQYFNQRFTPQQAITHLQETHRLYPELEILARNGFEQKKIDRLRICKAIRINFIIRGGCNVNEYEFGSDSHQS